MRSELLTEETGWGDSTLTPLVLGAGGALEKLLFPPFPPPCLTLASLQLAWSARREVGSCYYSLGNGRFLLSLASPSRPELMGESLFPGTDSLHARFTPARAEQLFLNSGIGLYLEGMVPTDTVRVEPMTLSPR